VPFSLVLATPSNLCTNDLSAPAPPSQTPLDSDFPLSSWKNEKTFLEETPLFFFLCFMYIFPLLYSQSRCNTRTALLFTPFFSRSFPIEDREIRMIELRDDE
jgi:hypothetical protein